MGAFGSLEALNFLLLAVVVSMWTLTPVIVACTFFADPMRERLERRRRIANAVRQAKQELMLADDRD